MSRRHSSTHKSPPGEGGRFASLSHQLAERGGVKDPAALAAVIGREKYGNKRMANWAEKGKKS